MLHDHGGARGAQMTIAAAFLAFGAWCLFAPADVIAVAVREEYRAGYPIAGLAIEALGCQAIAAGLFAAFARFKSWTFPGFALSLLPIFLADWWLYRKAFVFDTGAILAHAAGLFTVVVLCVAGFAALRRQELAEGRFA